MLCIATKRLCPLAEPKTLRAKKLSGTKKQSQLAPAEAAQKKTMHGVRKGPPPPPEKVAARRKKAATYAALLKHALAANESGVSDMVASELFLMLPVDRKLQVRRPEYKSQVVLRPRRGRA